jgi:hypothetical protein
LPITRKRRVTRRPCDVMRQWRPNGLAPLALIVRQPSSSLALCDT